MNDEKEASTTTPPLSYQDSHLLTPPPTDERASSTLQRIFRAIEQYKRGRLTSDQCWLGFSINTIEYTELKQRLSADEFCQNKLRWGYFPLQSLFVIRMPTPIHEIFLASVHGDIQAQLRGLTKGPSAEFTKDIKFTGSTTYEPIDPDFGRHDPDGSFLHTKERFPGVVIEGAYSQKKKMLVELAEDYILGSNLKIRAMVGFNIEYRKKEATFSTWRPQLRGEGDEAAWRVDSEVRVIRHADGKLNDDPEVGLLLHLRDFASVKFCDEFKGDLDGTIFISCKRLCEYLIEAESIMHATLAPNSPEPNLRKRRWTPEPEEELDTDDERSIVQAEVREAKRVEREDPSYKGSSSIASDNS